MINCIVAIEKNQGIGFNGLMPWPHLRGDMQWFKSKTTNQVIIMGSTTWKSLNCKPLPNRINVVLSKKENYSGPGKADHTFDNPETALTFCLNEYFEKEIFIIGGSEIYNFYLPFVNKFYITEINESYNCDKFFNLAYVQTNFKNIKEVVQYNDPVNYIIKEYTP
jgi:dihydrofolate reductase